MTVLRKTSGPNHGPLEGKLWGNADSESLLGQLTFLCLSPLLYSEIQRSQSSKFPRTRPLADNR